jgi:hypothetical protein
MPRSTLFWNLWIILILLGLQHPHSCAPYCYTGVRICLHISSLLFVVICDLRPINHDRSLLLISSSSFFFFICAFHLRHNKQTIDLWSLVDLVRRRRENKWKSSSIYFISLHAFSKSMYNVKWTYNTFPLSKILLFLYTSSCNLNINNFSLDVQEEHRLI